MNNLVSEISNRQNFRWLTSQFDDMSLDKLVFTHIKTKAVFKAHRSTERLFVFPYLANRIMNQSVEPMFVDPAENELTGALSKLLQLLNLS
jgi:hypothetical protein